MIYILEKKEKAKSKIFPVIIYEIFTLRFFSSKFTFFNEKKNKATKKVAKKWWIIEGEKANKREREKKGNLF